VHTCYFRTIQTSFSVAGLTIAKDWSRLAPQKANKLIFLHDAIPAMRRFEESQHDGV
jgi:hypothetical protein